MSTICLNMIVKNESAIIEETLRNIVAHVPLTYWVISDTGSTDGTQDIIKKTMAELGLPGDLHEDNWVNFGANRRLALEHCAGKADYVLFFDADDYFEGKPDWPETLTAVAYHMNLHLQYSSTRFQRVLLARNDGSVTWRGVVHEFVANLTDEPIDTIWGDYEVIACSRGNRSQDTERYLKDAQTLEQAILSGEDPDLHARYRFYCAQSYMDADRDDKAIYWYEQRVEHGFEGWSEEVYIAYMRLGFLYEKQGDEAKAAANFMLGAAWNPNRAECWYHLSRLHSWKGRYALAYEFAKKAPDFTVEPVGVLFSNSDVYRYWLAFEWFNTAFALGKFDEAYQALKQLIEHAPTDLYKNDLEKLKQLNSQLLQDTYHNVIYLKLKLHEKDANEVSAALGIF